MPRIVLVCTAHAQSVVAGRLCSVPYMPLPFDYNGI